MAAKELTLEELKTVYGELETVNKAQAETIADLTNKLKASDAKSVELARKLADSESEVQVSEGVVDGLKQKIANLEVVANEVSEGSKTLHKIGKKKYRLLYEVSFEGSQVNDEVLAGNEKLLGKLLESGSGALQEVL